MRRKGFIVLVMISILTIGNQHSVSFAAEGDTLHQGISGESSDQEWFENQKDTNVVDEAFYKMLNEENYIISLINDHGEQTTRTNWEFNLKYLKNKYDVLAAQSEVNMPYVNSYIEAYEQVKQTKNLPDKKLDKKLKMSNYYSSTSATSYARRYYSSYNMSYPDWSGYEGDDTNFVSQCLYEGGKSMQGNPGSGSNADDWSNWFSWGTHCDTQYVSATWRNANAFKNFWQSNASSYQHFSRVGSGSYSYGFEGDAVSLLNENGRAYHTMLIIGYAVGNDLTVASHSANTITARLSDYVTSGGFIIYRMR